LADAVFERRTDMKGSLDPLEIIVLFFVTVFALLLGAVILVTGGPL